MTPTEPREPGGAVEAAKALLSSEGFVVLKAESYRRARERQRVAEALKDYADENARRAEDWGRQQCTEWRRLSDRLTFVYGVARAHGATIEELAGDQDWTAAELGMELNSLHLQSQQHGHGNWPDHYPTAWRLLAAFLALHEAQTLISPPTLEAS